MWALGVFALQSLGILFPHQKFSRVRELNVREQGLQLSETLNKEREEES